MAVSSSHRWRLTLDARQRLIKAGPGRRFRGPNRHGRCYSIRIVQRANANKNQMWPRFCLAEQMHPATRAEAAMHDIAAVGNAAIVTSLAAHAEGFSAKARVDRSTASADVLTKAAPTRARGDRFGAALVTHGSANTPAGDRHATQHSQK